MSATLKVFTAAGTRTDGDPRAETDLLSAALDDETVYVQARGVLVRIAADGSVLVRRDEA